jgi:hypothetical protein
MTPDELERFGRKIRHVADGCWRWTGALTHPTEKKPHGGGYAICNIGGKTQLAHRASYEHHVGPIPAGLQLDHLCHPDDGSCPGGTNCLHRRCVNPAHVTPSTGRDNSRRTGNATKDECPQKHPYDEANTYVDKTGRRHCRTCSRARTQRWYEEQGGAQWHQNYHQNVRKSGT